MPFANVLSCSWASPGAAARKKKWLLTARPLRWVGRINCTNTYLYHFPHLQAAAGASPDMPTPVRLENLGTGTRVRRGVALLRGHRAPAPPDRRALPVSRAETRARRGAGEPKVESDVRGERSETPVSRAAVLLIAAMQWTLTGGAARVVDAPAAMDPLPPRRPAAALERADLAPRERVPAIPFIEEWPAAHGRREAEALAQRSPPVARRSSAVASPSSSACGPVSRPAAPDRGARPRRTLRRPDLSPGRLPAFAITAGTRAASPAGEVQARAAFGGEDAVGDAEEPALRRALARDAVAAGWSARWD